MCKTKLLISKTKMMRKIISVIVVAAFLVTTSSSCEEESLIGIQGKGDIVSKTIEIQPINGIDLDINGNVIISKGDNQEIRIKAQNNIIENIKTNVKNGVWDIDFDKNVLLHKDITIYITVPEIKELSVSGSGNITSSSNFSSSNLEINISGSGYINFNTKANHIKSHISGSGEIDLSGTTNSQDIHISGSGSYNGFSCVSNNVDADISGSGNCNISVNKELNAKISGSGDIKYKGHPSINKEIIGSGSVTSSN